ncbi:MAG TPA: prepilin-type N-terminal cleavage/methylation domain-containing protein [Gemmatimonadales bacterium]|nr:prepilin-type N-terminal cleavage/methylation domain-containing protein [Gemmatimonadales bacterium]
MRGVTLPEVLVALVILAVGLVGLASAGAAASRLASRGHWEARAAGLASQRIETLRRDACRGPTSGVEVRGPLTLSWALEGSAGPSYRRVFVSVTPDARVGGPAMGFVDIVPC